MTKSRNRNKSKATPGSFTVRMENLSSLLKKDTIRGELARFGSSVLSDYSDGSSSATLYFNDLVNAQSACECFNNKTFLLGKPIKMTLIQDDITDNSANSEAVDSKSTAKYIIALEERVFKLEKQMKILTDFVEDLSKKATISNEKTSSTTATVANAASNTTITVTKTKLTSNIDHDASKPSQFLPSSMVSSAEPAVTVSTIEPKVSKKHRRNRPRNNSTIPPPENDESKSYCTISKVSSLSTLDGDGGRLVAKVDGWDVVVCAGAFQVSDLCVYVPIDTLVDTSKNHFSEYAQKDSSDVWVRVQSERVGGTFVSQGIALPVASLPKELQAKVVDAVQREAMVPNLDTLLSVRKYTKPEPRLLHNLKGVAEHKEGAVFPEHFIAKSDELHLRSKPQCLEEVQGVEMYMSKKMDGNSMTVLVDSRGEFSVCSRKKVVDKGSAFYQYAEMTGLETKLRSLGYPIAIQGELCGPNIPDNNNRMGMDSYDLFLYTARRLPLDAPDVNVDSADNAHTETETLVSTAAEQKHVDPVDLLYGLAELEALAEQLQLSMPPVLQTFTMDASWDVTKFQAAANDVKYQVKGKEDGVVVEVAAEGIVLRAVKPVWSKVLHKPWSVKVINQSYRD